MKRKYFTAKNHLDFYFQCMETGLMPSRGLCNWSNHTELFHPPGWYSEARGFNAYDDWYWGYNGENKGRESDFNRKFKFTPLRQNIVLLMAAMSNEL